MSQYYNFGMLVTFVAGRWPPELNILNSDGSNFLGRAAIAFITEFEEHSDSEHATHRLDFVVE